MMRNVIKNFAKQFAYEPKIERAEGLGHHRKFVVAGMGGSHLAADLLKVWKPSLDLVVHMDYGEPVLADLKERLFIASSYSGNTEEVIDALEHAQARGLKTAVIAVGGKLLEIAKTNNLPYIQMPNTGIQSRSALGFSIKALMKLMSEEDGLREVSKLAETLNPDTLEQRGKELAERLKGHVPVIYSSTHNLSIAYNWKIKFNETGKIPAFYNVFSELNHNEMTGFDTKGAGTPRDLVEKFHFIFLKDRNDHERVLKRMAVLERQYRDRGLPVEVQELIGANVFEKIFISLIFADWTAYYTAEQYGLESEQVPMIEEFKNLIK